MKALQVYTRDPKKILEKCIHRVEKKIILEWLKDLNKPIFISKSELGILTFSEMQSTVSPLHLLWMCSDPWLSFRPDGKAYFSYSHPRQEGSFPFSSWWTVNNGLYLCAIINSKINSKLTSKVLAAELSTLYTL